MPSYGVDFVKLCAETLLLQKNLLPQLGGCRRVFNALYHCDFIVCHSENSFPAQRRLF
jgi:hypothetical protein